MTVQNKISSCGNEFREITGDAESELRRNFSVNWWTIYRYPSTQLLHTIHELIYTLYYTYIHPINYYTRVDIHCILHRYPSTELLYATIQYNGKDNLHCIHPTTSNYVFHSAARCSTCWQRIMALESSYLCWRRKTRLWGLGQWRVFIDVIGPAWGNIVNTLDVVESLECEKNKEKVVNTKNNENVNDAGK